MSLNSYEQTVFDYWQNELDELRHWQNKVKGTARGVADPTEVARSLERELWDYFMERSQFVPKFQSLHHGTPRRVSFLNLAEYVLRLWASPPKPKKSQPPSD